jgi:hypothetical protein
LAFFRQIRDDSSRQRIDETLVNIGRDEVGRLLKTIVVNFESGAFNHSAALPSAGYFARIRAGGKPIRQQFVENSPHPSLRVALSRRAGEGWGEGGIAYWAD